MGAPPACLVCLKNEPPSPCSHGLYPTPNKWSWLCSVAPGSSRDLCGTHVTATAHDPPSDVSTSAFLRSLLTASSICQRPPPPPPLSSLLALSRSLNKHVPSSHLPVAPALDAGRMNCPEQTPPAGGAPTSIRAGAPMEKAQNVVSRAELRPHM